MTEPEQEERYTLTQRGRLTLHLTRAIEGMLVEQRHEFLAALQETVLLLQQEEDPFKIGCQLAEALTMLGFSDNGDRL